MFGHTQTSTVKCDGLVGWTPTVGVFVYKREEKMWNKVTEPLLPCEARPMLEKPYFPQRFIVFESPQQINYTRS